MADNKTALMAHLIRRAGFGAPRDELDAYVSKGYEQTVEELIHPENQPDIDLFLVARYLPEYESLEAIDSNQQGLLYRMINTGRPLQEKMALFWHGILCTGHAKVDHGRPDDDQHRHVPPAWHGKLPGAAGGIVEAPHHGPVPGQHRQPQGGHQRELRQGTAGALLNGRRHGRRVQLHRGRP